MNLIYLIYFWFLFQGVIAACYNSVISLHDCVMAFNRMNWFLTRVLSITLFGLFVWLGYFQLAHLMLIFSASLAIFHQWKGLVTSGQSTQPPLACLLGSSLFFSAYQVDFLVKINGLVDRLVLVLLFRENNWPRPIRRISVWGTACPYQSACRTRHD